MASMVDKLKAWARKDLVPSGDVKRPAPKPVDGDARVDRAAVEAAQLANALKMYELQLPLDHVKVADPTGRLAAAIEALSYDMLASDAADQAVSDDLPVQDAAGSQPAWADDVVFFDRVRQVLGHLHIPFSDMDDLEVIAAQHDWTRENIGETMEGMGIA